VVEPSEVIGCVYLVTNKVNEKKYVGQTKKTVIGRWKAHLNAAKNDSPYALHRAIRKYGKESFTIECVEEVVGTHLELVAAEIRQVALYASTFPGGYNMTRGGDGIDLLVHATKERQMAGIAKRSQNPEWLKKQLEASQRIAKTPEWQQAHAEGIKKRGESPEWLKNLHVGIANRPPPRPNVIETLRKNAQAQSATALERDALLTPEEADYRVRHRLYRKRSKAKKKAELAGNPYPNAQEARDTLRTPEEILRRAKERERDRRRYAATKVKKLAKSENT